MRHLKPSRKRYITKTASANCGIGATMQEWGFQDTAKCPRCSEEHETTTHVQRCSGHGADEVFEKSLLKLQAYLTDENTHPELQEAIVTCLQRWRDKKPIRLQEFSTEMRDVIRDQHEIGWQQLLEGLPAKKWQTMQQLHYRREEVRKSSRRWLRGLLLQLHQIGHRQWKHRCDIKNQITQPTEKEQEDNIHEVIEEEYVRGAGSLMPGDKNLMEYNLIQLLNKTLAYKIGWVTRVGAARQRALRRRMADNQATIRSRQASKLYKWLQAPCRRPTKRTKRTHTTPEEDITMQLEVPVVVDRQYLEHCVAESIQDPQAQADREEEEHWTQDRTQESSNDAAHE
ncbi:MAG: hypothetical protein ACRCZI_03340 [Cetobacterium sp.]